MGSLQELIGDKVINNNGEMLEASKLQGDNKFIGLYFSAHWCPPCRSFTPTLAEFYSKMKESSPGKLEIVFVSCDSDEASFQEYFSSMPWLSIPFSVRGGRKEALGTKYEVSGIPTLIILDANTLEVVNPNARTMVMWDKEGKDFPWKQ